MRIPVCLRFLKLIILLALAIFPSLTLLYSKERGFSPSIICGNSDSLEQLVQLSEEALKIGRDSFHLDVFDGEFVISKGFSMEEIRKIRQLCRLPLQIHIIANNPSLFISELKLFLRKNFDTIIIHAEIKECEMAAKEILAEGLLLGIALKAETNIKELDPYKYDLSTVLIMTVSEIGKRGLTVYPDAYERVTAVRKYLESCNLCCSLLVDGGIYEGEVEKLALAGATDFVIGSAFYGRDGQKKPKDLLKKLETELEFTSNQKF